VAIKDTQHMSYKTITKVFTIIYKGRQQVGFQIEGIEKCIYLSPLNVEQDTKIKITEVELLIGSKIRPEFYKLGEIMFNGKVFYEGFPVIKDFRIKCADTIENLRIANSGKLLKFKEIFKVFHFNRNNNETVGFEIGEEKAIFIQAKRLLNQTSLSLNEIHILEGSYISPEYFKEGENINEGIDMPPKLCIKSGVVLKHLNLRFWGKVNEMHKKFENSDSTTYQRNYRSGKHYFQNDYSNDSNNWLEDVAGSDDPEVMNDVYWNLD
jgi:hypothetical protein